MAELISNLQERLNTALELNNKKPIDLCNALNLPKSAVSQYLSGKSKKMDAVRLYEIANFLKVDEAWLIGYNVPMKKMSLKEQAKLDSELLKDSQLKYTVRKYLALPEEKRNAVKQIIDDYYLAFCDGD